MPAPYGTIANRSGHAEDGVLFARAPINSRVGTEVTTNVAFKAGDVILGCWVYLTAAEATATTKTIDVGLNGSGADDDPNGFLAAVSTASAGMVKGTLASGGQTLGALLRVDESGGGVLVPEGHVVTSASPLTYTLGEAATEVAGDICVVFFRPAP